MVLDSITAGSDWKVGLRLWLEHTGRSVLGKGRSELLEAIDRWHSISEAARRMGMSYRQAWLLVQSMNEAAGEPLVLAATGGSHGGGAQLTPYGRRLLAVFREVEGMLCRSAEAALPVVLGGALSSTVHVAASISLEDVLRQLLCDYAAQQPGVRVRTIFGAADELTGLVLAGAPADLFLAADGRCLDRLEQAGLARPDARAVLAENTLVIIGSPDSALTVHKAADLLRPRIGRIALAERDSPLGGYSHAYLKRAGLYEAVAARALTVDNAQGVVAAVRAGRADVGLAYGSAATRPGDCRVLFRIRRLPAPIRYQATVITRGGQGEAAHRLLAFLTAPVAARRFRQCGFASRSCRP